MPWPLLVLACREQYIALPGDWKSACHAFAVINALGTLGMGML